MLRIYNNKKLCPFNSKYEMLLHAFYIFENRTCITTLKRLCINMQLLINESLLEGIN